VINARFSAENKCAAHIVDTRRTVKAGCFYRNVLVLVKVDASVTAAEELTVFTPHTAPDFATLMTVLIQNISPNVGRQSSLIIQKVITVR